MTSMSNPEEVPQVNDKVCEQLRRILFSYRGDDPSGSLGMFQKGLALLKLSWPLGVVALPFGTVYCLLLYLFPDSIDAYVKMRTYTVFSRWGGVEVFFVLNSAVLGWVSVVVSERRTGAARFILLLIALPWCFASIGGGFALAPLCLGRLSDAMWEMMAYSLVSVVCAGALRAYLGDIL